MIITLKILNKKYIALAIWPFIFFKSDVYRFDTILINHEKIHLKQQIETGWLLFFVWYILEFIFRLIQYRNWDTAYRNISFEREAYKYEENLDYLKNRKNWGFWRFLKKP